MRFVDRESEMRRLDSILERKEGALAAIWGRRRVGKTRILLEWCRRHGGLYTVADQSAEPVQRRYFAEAVSTRFAGFSEVLYPDWHTLLRTLSREAARASWSGPLVLDEFPYLVASSRALPSVLQNWVDHEAKEAGLVVAIAGSMQHMMRGLALGSSSPLYGRAREAFAIRPLEPGYIREALGLRDRIEGIRAYSVWGGIPRYWELAEPFGIDLDRAVDALVLDPMGPLHTEPDRLLMEEMPPALSLRSILDAIGSGAHRVSEIAGRVGQPTTSLSRPLARLVEMGLVGREHPFGESETGSKRALYRIADPFFRLWFKVVAPRRALLAGAPPSVRTRIWRDARAGLFAETWESLSRSSVPRIGAGASRLGALGPWGPAHRYWRGKGPEWDVVSLSLDKKSVLVGEVKWHEETASEPLIARAYQGLVRKGAPEVAELRDRGIVHAVFVPRCSAARKRQEGPFLVVDAEDVMAALR